MSYFFSFVSYLHPLVFDRNPIFSTYAMKIEINPPTHISKHERPDEVIALLFSDNIFALHFTRQRRNEIQVNPIVATTKDRYSASMED